MSSDHDPSDPLGDELLQLPLPLDIFEPKKEIRPEYNIGKYAGYIFASPYAKNVREVRTYEWDFTRGDQTLKAELTITPRVGLKTPTTTTLRVYLALVQVWENMGSPADGVVEFSARQLCNVIGWRWAGKDTADRIYEHLKVLSGTAIEWVFSYTTRNKAVEDVFSDMSIIQSADYRRRHQLFEPEKFSAVQRVRFNSELVLNMLAGHVRPLNYEAFRQIGNDTTANLYMKIELYLHGKPKWERRAFGLLRDDLGLTGKRYEKRFNRHAKLKDFVAELDGVELFTGTLRLAIEETADQKDWKLVAWKEGARASVPRLPRHRLLKPVHTAEEAALLADELIDEIQRQPESGEPKRGYIEFLCKHYPQALMRRALSTAKADYRGEVKKTLTHVFVYEVERLVKEDPKLQWYKKETGERR